MKRHVLLLLLFAAVLTLVPAYLRAFTITGASEIPTLLVGDTIIVNDAAYSLTLPYSSRKLFRIFSPQRGDLACLQIPDDPRLQGRFIKRIVGLPGEVIELRENRVVINAQAVTATALNRREFAWVPKARPIGSIVENEGGHWITYSPGKSEHRNHPPTRLKEGQYFVLGDNRDDSYDSREFGPVSVECILGKVIAIVPTGERVR